MRRTILLLASLGFIVLLASGVALAQEIDTTPPDTTIDQKPSALSNDLNPSFSFSSNESNATFECQLDGGAYQSCSPPKQYFLLSEGQHTFQVQARDASGNVDLTPASYTWAVDSLPPKVTFTEKPATVTNDRTPSWAWTVEDANSDPDGGYCRLSDYNRMIFDSYGCSSPLAFGGELPDADYSFWIQASDKASNYGYSNTSYFEVDTVAPKFVSGKPTGKKVGRYADVVVTFDDDVYGSKKFVNVYKKGSNTPMAIAWREEYGKKIEISTKSAFKRDTWYTVKVTAGVNDGANNLEAPKTWKFKTK